MIIKHVLLLIPIHRRTCGKYYQERDRYVSIRREAFQKQSGLAWDTISRPLRLTLEAEWSWPPWLVNDVIGFLEIGSDGWNDMGCDVYLKRRNFPRASREREGQHTSARNNEFLRYAETPHYSIKADNNGTYLKAL